MEPKAGERKVTIVIEGDGKPNTNAVAETLARHITGGDARGYLRRIVEEKENAPPEDATSMQGKTKITI